MLAEEPFLGVDLVKVFADDGQLAEERVANLEVRVLAVGRDFEEPIRLVPQIYLNQLEGDTLVGEYHPGPLNVGASIMSKTPA